MKLELNMYTSINTLRIPIDSQRDDAIGIIEFYLNAKWTDIHTKIQQDIFTFIQSKQSKFKQKEGILEILKY